MEKYMLSLPLNVSELIYSQLYMSELYSMLCVSKGYNESVKKYMKHSKLRKCKCGCDETREVRADYVENCVLSNSKILFTDRCWFIYKDICGLEDSFRNVYYPSCKYLVEGNSGYTIQSEHMICNKTYPTFDKMEESMPDQKLLSDCLLSGIIKIYGGYLVGKKMAKERDSYIREGLRDKRLYEQFAEKNDGYLLADSFEDVKEIIYNNDKYLELGPQYEQSVTADYERSLNEYLLDENMNSMDMEKTSESYKEWLKIIDKNIEDDEDNSVNKLTEDLMSKLRICRENRRIKLGY